ncbi:MAG: hypothetical protein WD357_01780 [Gracilimonas sp.]
MIILHKKESHSESDRLEERLKDLVISFKTEIHSERKEGLPHIEEDGKIYKTEEEIEKWVQELAGDLSWQRSLSGDGCYIDPNKGKIW